MQSSITPTDNLGAVSPPRLATKSHKTGGKKTVRVVDYDPAWPAQFRSLHGRIAGVLRLMVSAIEHVGGTAVPGLASAPVLDIDVLLLPNAVLATVIHRLVGVGYVRQGDFNTEGFEIFRPRSGAIPHRLCVCLAHGGEFRRHMALRNYLRAHPKEARKYGELKKALALRFPDDTNSYLEGKLAFVDELTTIAIAEKRKGVSAGG